MTQIERVRRHIDEHGTISSLDAFREYGITRLADVIFKLRRLHGWTIETTIKENVNRYGEKVMHGVYRKISAYPYINPVKRVM
jgi:predicted nuclease of restriction endonuclease-like RecB superfamily